MLILYRREGESVMIEKDLQVIVMGISPNGKEVRLGFVGKANVQRMELVVGERHKKPRTGKEVRSAESHSGTE